MPLAVGSRDTELLIQLHDQVAGPPAQGSCARIGYRTAFSSPSTTSSVTDWKTLMIRHENHVHHLRDWAVEG